ncbi:hypothetical protein GQ600_4036 [Phytophthora cactorum]|nr:hypothetical protein GQ600_4036 [Phytophthora cactorum]
MLVEAGVPVYHRTCMMHYKLLTLTYGDTIFCFCGKCKCRVVTRRKCNSTLPHQQHPLSHENSVSFYVGKGPERPGTTLPCYELCAPCVPLASHRKLNSTSHEQRLECPLSRKYTPQSL